MARVKLVHVFTAFRSLGGVETVLQRHYELDADLGLDSEFIILAEPQDDPVPRVHFLGFDRHTSIRMARQCFRQAIARIRPEIAVYETMWCLPHLVGLDGAARRLLVLHGVTPGMEHDLRRRQIWLDGLLGVNRSLRDTFAEWFPDIEAERLGWLNCPIYPPSQYDRPPESLADRPLVVGFCSRLSREQKRIDRLPELCRRLDQTGLAYRLEVLGDGPDRGDLEHALEENSQVKFHGMQRGRTYWEILSGWDVIIFTSDYEGTPIALLEAMSLGVLPLYPKIGTGGEAYVESVDPSLIYAAGRIDSAVQRLHALARMDPDARLEWRRRSRTAVYPHLGDSYFRELATFIQHLRDLPPRASTSAPHIPFPFDRLTFSQLARLRKWKDRLTGSGRLPSPRLDTLQETKLHHRSRTKPPKSGLDEGGWM